MELRSVHKSFPHSPLGGEKHQMLNLNHRLETYLGQVRLLEEENELLAREVRALRRNNHGASARRQGLEEELWRARLEVDAAWGDRVHTELEAGRVAEELQALELQRQREAQAQVEANRKLEHSRKELEEEQRAQVWLREQVGQLEDQMRHLIRSHQEDVAHLEATLTQSRATMAPTLAQRGYQTPDLQQLGQEYSHRATRAWQEAAEAHQGHLDRLEESLTQTRSRLTQVGQEKSESQLELRALEKELEAAQHIRMHLEKTAAQQEAGYRQEVQLLQEHLDGLEAEREELGQQVDHVLEENQDLLQQKRSLGREVATYRALLDSERLGGRVPLFNQPRDITDAGSGPWGVKRSHQTRLSAGHKTTSRSPARGSTERGPAAFTATPTRRRTPVPLADTPQGSSTPDTTQSAAWETPYPKILQGGAVENFRPQEVHEEVSYAEPLSPPNEQEAGTTSGGEGGEEDWNNVGEEPTKDGPVVQSVASHQAGLSTEPPPSQHQSTTAHLTPDSVRPTEEPPLSQHQSTTAHLTPDSVSPTEEPRGFSHESHTDVPFERRVERELHAPVDAWAREREREFIERQREHVPEETSGFETEAVTSKPASEREPEESSLDRETDLSPEESTLKEHEAELRQEVSCPRGGTNQTDVEDKLYPDGEEMDTWDSVIERKVDPKTEEGIKKDEGQHAEPEEDISEQKHETRGRRSDSATGEHPDDDEAPSVMDTQVDDDGRHAALDREHALSPDSEEDDDEEDSQNVSVSWRTELEGDSYAQDNTLADTRPLIRYESDEAAGNAQAPHVDESDSSEGEPEQKVGETGMWSEGESKRFGTMEDLCEEVEGEALDEEYAHMENRDEGHGQTLREQATLGNAEGMIRKVSEGQSDVETEEGTKPTTPTNLCSDEELETDRLVEQELESLATESYSAHFAQQQGSGSEEAPNQEAAIESCTEPDLRGDQQLSSSTTITGQADEDLYLCDWSVVVPPADPLVDEEVQHKDQEEIEAPEEEHNASMVTEGPCSFTVFTSRPDGEDINASEDPNSVLQVPAEQEDLQHVAAVKEEASGADHKEFPEAPETAEWEVLENPSEDFEFGDQSEDYEKCDNVPESAESYLHDDGGSDEVSPVSGPDEKDLFVGKDSAQVNTNGKDNSLHGFCSSGLTKEMWVSSMETGAAHQPGEAWNEAAQRANHSVLNVVHSRVDMDSSQAQNAEKEPEHSEVEQVKQVKQVKQVEQVEQVEQVKQVKQVKQVEQVEQVKQVEQVLRRNVAEGEFVCSDESDGDGESWSSGEEPV